MKKIICIFFSCLINLSLFPQKVNVQVIRTGVESETSWQVLDSLFQPVFSGNEYFRNDTVDFSLEADKKYKFEVSVSDIGRHDSSLYVLVLNGEPVILVDSGCGYGDHFFPFFTGVKQDPLAKITGGSDAVISDFPWQIYLESGDFVCGGSLIANNWVLTAAHCTRDDNDREIAASAMDVIVGANNPRSGTQGKKYYVSQVVAHEDFNSSTLDNDIALLKLAEPVNYENATPIKLVSATDAATGATDPGVMSWVTGYGLTKVRPATYPATLQKVQLPIISRTQALTVWKNIPATDLMAGYMNGNKDACTGDSGGPLIVPVAGRFKQAGIVSWGSSNCNTYGAYTRISDFDSWITAQTGIEISFTAPLPNGDSIICQGINSTEYYAAPITGATDYQWEIADENAGSVTSGSNQALVYWNPDFTGTTLIRLRVTRSADISEWSELKVTVAKNTRIKSQPHDTTLCAEKSFDLAIDAEGYNIDYSWYNEGGLIQKRSSATLSFSDLSTSNSGVYHCSADGACGSAVSSDINITILPVTRITDITTDRELAFGQTAKLEVTAEGHDLTYEWLKDDTPTADGTASILELHEVNAGDIGLYRVVVEGTCGIETSRQVYVYVKKQDHTTDPEVFLWPSPAGNELNVALSNDQYYTIILSTITGKMLKRESGCRYLETIPMTIYQPGIYIVTVYYGSFRKSVKIVKAG